MLSRALRARGIVESTIHTGQHYDPLMSQIFFDELEILAPQCHLSIGSGSHGAQTGRMIEAIEGALIDRRPDWVVLFGDTNTTLAGAIAAAKLHIPIAHVEAGLRSFNRRMPEEINRILTDHASTLLFTPTPTATNNLLNEGISRKQIYEVGDVMLDAVLFYRDRADKVSTIVSDVGLTAKQYVLATIHRAENTDDSERLQRILSAFVDLANHLPIVFPVHPRTRGVIEALGSRTPSHPNLHLLEPLGYLDMIQLEKSAAVILTDSGGIQKEALFLQVPCVVIREQTEWVENLSSGISFLTPPTSSAALVDAALKARNCHQITDLLKDFGSGEAAERIAETLVTWR